MPQTSARLRARISGALYVLCIGCGFFAEMVVRAKLVVYSDAAATAHNIAAAPELYRAGFFADVSAMTLGVLSSVLLYTLFKAVSRELALTVLVLDVISNTVSIGGSILQGDGYLSVLTASQLSSLALLSIKLYESVYAISLGLFGGSCLLTGYLIFRSTFLPILIGEVTFARWLLIAGVNSAKWDAIARTQAALPQGSQYTQLRKLIFNKGAWRCDMLEKVDRTRRQGITACHGMDWSASARFIFLRWQRPDPALPP